MKESNSDLFFQKKNQNVSEQVASYMRDPSRMIKQMQQSRSTVAVFGTVSFCLLNQLLFSLFSDLLSLQVLDEAMEPNQEVVVTVFSSQIMSLYDYLLLYSFSDMYSGKTT